MVGGGDGIGCIGGEGGAVGGEAVLLAVDFEGSLVSGDAAGANFFAVEPNAFPDQIFGIRVITGEVPGTFFAAEGNGFIQAGDILGGDFRGFLGFIQFADRGDILRAQRRRLGGAAFLIEREEIEMTLPREVHQAEFGGFFLFGFVLPFFLGEKAAVEILEGGEFILEFRDGFAGGEGFEQAAFEQGDQGGAKCARGMVALVLQAGGCLPEDGGLAGLAIGGEVKPAEGAVAGLELQAALGTGFGDDVEDIGVGVAVAEVDDFLLVLRREEFEAIFGFHGSRWVGANQA